MADAGDLRSSVPPSSVGEDNGLSEADIPGAALDINSLDLYRVHELKFWLSCRGDSRKNLPTKAACIQRIRNYIRNGQDKLVVDPSENGIYVRVKSLTADPSQVSQAQDTLKATSTTSQCIRGDYWMTDGAKFNWSKDLTQVPVFTIKELELFFNDSGKTAKTSKRAESILYDNFLDKLQCCRSPDFFYIRGICSASYTKSKTHTLSIALDGRSANVEYAHCSCIAGKGGMCNHSYALMKMIAQFVLDKCEEIPQLLPCTSRPCGWTVPQVRKMNVAKPAVMDMTIKKPRVHKPSQGVQCTLYEARSPSVRDFDLQTTTTMQNNLRRQFDGIPLVNGLRNRVNTNEWVQTKFGRVPIFSPMAYQCSKLGNNFNTYLNISPLPSNLLITCDSYPVFPHNTITHSFQYNISELTESERDVLHKLEVSSAQAVEIEENTRDQSGSKLWFKERLNRVTASKIYDVSQWKRSFSQHAEKFTCPTPVNAFLERKFAHGKLHESVAWEKYTQCMNERDKCVAVFTSGLVIDPNNCWLACSPDAKIIHGNIYGIGESKCPEQHKHCDLYDVAQSSETFMLYVNEQNELDLRKSHSAYYQIQCQLAVTGAHFCDLVVYTFKSLAIVRIQYDEIFWNNIFLKVGEMYFRYILPKLKSSV